MGHHTIDAQLVKIVQDNIDRSTVGPYLWSTVSAKGHQTHTNDWPVGLSV